ncbi:MAG: site-2 protease family protein [Planctomycetota bacterium]|nr:site-2 protease family protein [Planctomycetota bacterium]
MSSREVEIIANPVDEQTTRVHWLTAMVVAGVIWLLAISPRGRDVLVLVGLWTVVVIVHVSVFITWGRVRSRTIEEIGLFFGPAVCSVRVDKMLMRINAIPLGGFVKFAGADERTGAPLPGSYLLLHRWERVGMNLAAPAATLVFAAVLLGPRAAVASFSAGFGQLVDAALHPRSVAVPLIAQLFELLESGRLLAVLGVLAAKSATVNLFPLPIMNGGHAIIEAAQRLVPIPVKVQTALQLASLFVALAVLATWLWALAAFFAQP